MHADSLRLADLTEWPMPAPRRKVRRARYVAPPDTEDADRYTTEEYMTADESYAEDDVPLGTLSKRWAQTLSAK